MKIDENYEQFIILSGTFVISKNVQRQAMNYLEPWLFDLEQHSERFFSILFVAEQKTTMKTKIPWKSNVSLKQHECLEISLKGGRLKPAKAEPLGIEG